VLAVGNCFSKASTLPSARRRKALRRPQGHIVAAARLQLSFTRNYVRCPAGILLKQCHHMRIHYDYPVHKAHLDSIIYTSLCHGIWAKSHWDKTYQNGTLLYVLSPPMVLSRTTRLGVAYVCTAAANTLHKCQAYQQSAHWFITLLAR